MATKFSQSFKNNVVEKVLTRAPEVTLEDLAKDYGIAKSTVGRWVRETRQTKTGDPETMTTKEKRPQDWNEAEKLQAIIESASLDDEEKNAWCRQAGIYAHHLSQWKQAIIQSERGQTGPENRAILKALKAENKQLKQELNRKEKALAETAALLVLKKKAQTLWASDEVN